MAARGWAARVSRARRGWHDEQASTAGLAMAAAQQVAVRDAATDPRCRAPSHSNDGAVERPITAGCLRRRLLYVFSATLARNREVVRSIAALTVLSGTQRGGERGFDSNSKLFF